MSYVPKSYLRAILNRELRSLGTNTVPALCEARLAAILHSGIPNFVFGEEGAQCDAGILVGTPPFPPSVSSLERLYKVQERYLEKRILLPIEFKTINLEPSPWHVGSRAGYQVMLTDKQRETCALFLVVNPAEPGWVAVVPRDVVLGNGDSKAQKAHFVSWEIVMTEHRMEPFPPEFLAFIVPIERLLEMVQNFLNFFRRPAAGWKNPYSGNTIWYIKAPKLQMVALLTTTSTSLALSLQQEKLVWKGFNSHSTGYVVERLMIKPGLGDIQLYHYKTKRRIILELKRNYANIIDDALVHRNGANPSENKWQPPVFGPLSSWDFILSTFGDSEPFNFFASQDRVPPIWFISSEDAMVRHVLDEGLSVHLLPDLDQNPKDFVGAAEKIVDEYLARTEPAKYNFSPPSEREVSQVLRSDEYQDKLAQPTRIQHRKLGGGVRGKGISHKEIEWLHQQVLRERCRERRFGWVIELGKHPTATHAYIPVAWVDEPPSVVDLDPHTLAVYVNFADIDTSDEPEPRPRWLPQFYRATHGLRSSVYVLFPARESLSNDYDLDLDCYIVPSHCLDGSKSVHAAVEKRMGRSGAPQQRLKAFRLTTGESITTYRYPAARAVDALDDLLTAWSIPNISVISIPGTLGSAYMGKVINSIADMRQRFLRVQFPGGGKDMELRKICEMVETASHEDSNATEQDIV